MARAQEHSDSGPDVNWDVIFVGAVHGGILTVWLVALAQREPIVNVPSFAIAHEDRLADLRLHILRNRLRYGTLCLWERFWRIYPMASTRSKDYRISDKEALRIAEETDVSPQQAKDLAKEHGKAKGEQEARKIKDEG